MLRKPITTVIPLVWFFVGTVAGWCSRESSSISRRAALIEGFVTGSALVTALPQPAYADITSKVGSSAALRSVKRSQKQLANLLPIVQSNDFLGVKEFLRTPPFAEVRKNCFALVRGGEDGPKANDLQVTYKAFIGSIEKIDGTASLGSRGRKIPPLQLSDEFDVVESTMRDFLKVAEEAMASPVQYDDAQIVS